MTSLMKKGLRRRFRNHCLALRSLNDFPDEEGITTFCQRASARVTGLNDFPDEEGITTSKELV